MTVLCYGDSNTWGYNPSFCFGGRYDAPWPEQLELLTGWKIINSGENGREIPRNEFEWNQLQKQLCSSSADLLIIMLGTNDLLQGASPETAAERLESFLPRIFMERSHILLIAPPVMKLGAWVPEQRLIDASSRLAECLKLVARRLGVRFADSGSWNISLAYDGVHFTEEGHRKFALEISKYLQNLQGGLR